MQYVQRAFTLIELMMVVAIIGILAAVAIPAYQDYIVRAQVAGVLTVLGSLKSPAVAYYAEHGKFPDKTELLSFGVVKLPSRYVADISIVKDSSGTVYTIAAVIPSTGVSDKIKDKILFIATPDNGKNWYCHRRIFPHLYTTGGDGYLSAGWTKEEWFSYEDGKYLPPNCRGLN